MASSHFDAIELLSRYETPLIKDMEPGDDVLEWVAAFVGSDTFRGAVDAFCEAHGDAFALLLTKGGPTTEQLAAVDAAWHELHLSFIDGANDLIEAFLVERGFTMAQYTARCDDEIQSAEARQRHTRLSFFVQILLACCEYEQFLNLMRRAADPEYYDKQELAIAAERVVFAASEPSAVDAALDSERAAAAQGFLDYLRANPDVTLDELTTEFTSRVKLT